MGCPAKARARTAGSDGRCDAAFLAQLLAFAPRRIVYVSCGPDTQARDLRVLVAAGYRLSRVVPFDLFPQTRHITWMDTSKAKQTPTK